MAVFVCKYDEMEEEKYNDTGGGRGESKIKSGRTSVTDYKGNMKILFDFIN